MKLYIDTNICYLGDLLIPKGHVKAYLYSSRTRIKIYNKHSLNDTVFYYDGLITGLTESDGTPYANWTALEIILQDYFDVSEMITITEAELLTNSIAHITFNKGAYGDSGALTGIDIADFTFTYTDNADTLITCELLHITDTSNNELSGGETEVYAHLYLAGQSDGNGTVELEAIADSIYDVGGTAMEDTETTGVLTLGAETIDFIPNLKGVSLYMDANDATTVNEDSDFIWTDKTNNGYVFEQDTAIDKPTNDIVTNQAIDFSDGQYLKTDQPVYLDDVNGFSIFMAYYHDGGDNIVFSSEAFAGILNNTCGILCRATSVIFSRFGDTGATFTTTIPAAAYNICELRFTSTQYEFYVNNVLSGTPVARISKNLLSFNLIGADNIQGLNDKLRNITVYNGTDATTRTAIYTKLAAKFIGQTELSNTSRTNYQIPLPTFGLNGDSNAIGRDETGDLTSPYEYILGANTNTLIGSSLQPTYYKIQEDYDPDTQYGGETTADDFGTEASMLYWIRQNNSYGAVMKFGDGGSYLGNSGAGDDWIKTREKSYQIALRFIGFCLQSFKDLMFNPDFKGIVMMIGYNDTTDGPLTAAFSANFAQFKIDVRTDLEMSTLWFRTHDIQNGAGEATINAAQVALAAADSYHSHTDFTDDMTLIDGVHYNADSIVQIGKNDFDTWFNIV